MSAIPPKADIAERDRHVRFVPIADISRFIRPLDQRARSMCREKQYRVLLLFAD